VERGLAVLHHLGDTLDGVRAADVEPGLAQQAEAVTVRMAVRCDSPERGHAVLDDCCRRSEARTCSMKRSVPSPENVVTEVAKALEQIS